MGSVIYNQSPATQPTSRNVTLQRFLLQPHCPCTGGFFGNYRQLNGAGVHPCPLALSFERQALLSPIPIQLWGQSCSWIHTSHFLPFHGFHCFPLQFGVFGRGASFCASFNHLVNGHKHLSCTRHCLGFRSDLESMLCRCSQLRNPSHLEKAGECTQQSFLNGRALARRPHC